MNEEWVPITKVKHRKVYCPKCGNLVGIQFGNKETQKVGKVKFTIGDVVYPTIDIKDYKPTIICQVCGHTFELQKVNT